MKVLILGGHGYLGPHVEKALEPYYQLRNYGYQAD